MVRADNDAQIANDSIAFVEPTGASIADGVIVSVDFQ